MDYNNSSKTPHSKLVNICNIVAKRLDIHSKVSYKKHDGEDVGFLVKDQLVAVLSPNIVKILSTGETIDLAALEAHEKALEDNIEASHKWAEANGYCTCATEECKCPLPPEDNRESHLSSVEKTNILTNCSLGDLRSLEGALSTLLSEDDIDLLMVRHYINAKSTHQ